MKCLRKTFSETGRILFTFAAIPLFLIHWFVSDIKNKLFGLIQSEKIELVATQTKISLPIVERMYRKMTAGVSFADIQIVDNAIMNGHHRYLASLLAGYALGRYKGLRPDVKKNVDWKDIHVDGNDWDQPEEIARFDAEDAKLLGISVEELHIIINNN